MVGIAYFANTGSIILSKATLDLVDCWTDFSELGAINLFGLGAHPGDGQDLSVLDAALLQLAKQDSETYGLSVFEILMRGLRLGPYLQHSRWSRSCPGRSALCVVTTEQSCVKLWFRGLLRQVVAMSCKKTLTVRRVVVADAGVEGVYRWSGAGVEFPNEAEQQLNLVNVSLASEGPGSGPCSWVGLSGDRGS